MEIASERIIILLDQDGVLADFEAKLFETYRERHPDEPFVPIDKRESFKMEDDYPEYLKPKLKEIYTEEGFFLSLQPIEGAFEAIREMESAGIIVRICTSPLTRYEHCVKEKFAWVEKHLGLAFTGNIVLAKDKTMVRGDILVDDKPRVTGTLLPVWEHVLFDQPYNRIVKNKRRIDDWSNWKEVLLGL